MRTQLVGVCVSTLWCVLVLTAQDGESIQTFLVNPQAKITKQNLKLDVPHTTTPKPKTEKEKSSNETDSSESSSEEVITDEEYYMALPRLCCWYNGNTFNKKRCGRSVDQLPPPETSSVQPLKLSKSETAAELKSLAQEIKKKKNITYDPELFDMISDILFGLPLHGPIKSVTSETEVSALQINGTEGAVVGEINCISDIRSDPELRAYLKDVYDLLYAQKNKGAHSKTKRSLRSRVLSAVKGDKESTGKVSEEGSDKEVVAVKSPAKNAVKDEENSVQETPGEERKSRLVERRQRISKALARVGKVATKDSGTEAGSGEKVKRSILSFPMAIIDQQLTEKQRKLTGQSPTQSRSNSHPTTQSTLSDFLDVVSNPSRVTPRYSSEEDFSAPRRGSDDGWGWQSEMNKFQSETSRRQPETSRNQPETSRHPAETSRRQPETSRHPAETSRRQPETSKYRQEARDYQPEMRKQQATSRYQSEMSRNKQETNRRGSETNKYQPEIRAPLVTTTAEPDFFEVAPDYEIPEFRLKSPQEIYLDAKLAEEANKRNSVPRERTSQTSVPQERKPAPISHDRQLPPSPQDRYTKNYATQERKFKSSLDHPMQERTGRPQVTQDKRLKGHGLRDDSLEYPSHKRIPETYANERIAKDFNLFDNSEESPLEEKNPRGYTSREKNFRGTSQDKHCPNSKRDEFLKLTSQKAGRDLEALLFKNEPEVDYDRKVREKSMDKIPEFPSGKEKLAARFPNLVNAFQTGASLNMDKLKSDSRRENLIQSFLDSHPQLKKSLRLNWRSDRNSDKESRDFDLSLEEEEMNKKPTRKQDPSVVFDDEFKPEDFEVLKLISDLMESTSEVKAKIKNESEEERSNLPVPRKSLLNRIWATTTPPPQLPKAPGVSYRRKESETPKPEIPKLEAPRPEISKPAKSAFPLERILKPVADIRPNSFEELSYESPERNFRWKRDHAVEISVPTEQVKNPEANISPDSWFDNSYSDESSQSLHREGRNALKFPGLTGFPGFNGYPMDASGFSSDDVSDVTVDPTITESLEDPFSRTMYAYLQSIENNVPTNYFNDPYEDFFLKFLEMENCLVSDDSACYEDPKCNKKRMARAPGDDEQKINNTTAKKNDTVAHRAEKKTEPLKTPEKTYEVTKNASQQETVVEVADASSEEQRKAEAEASLDKFLSNFEAGNSDKALEALAKNSMQKSPEQSLEKITGSFDRFTFYDVESDDFDKSLVKNLAKKDTGSVLKSKLESKTRNSETAPAEEPKFTHEEPVQWVEEIPESVKFSAEPAGSRPDATKSVNISAANYGKQTLSKEVKPKKEKTKIASNEVEDSKHMEVPKSKPGQSPKSESVEPAKSKPIETPKSKCVDTPKTQASDASNPISSDTPESKQAETQKSKLVETLKTKPAETPKAKPRDNQKAKPETPKPKPTEAPKSKSAVVEKSNSAEKRAAAPSVQKPKVPSLPISGLPTSSLLSGTSGRQLQLPVSNWKDNKAALMEKISTNVEIGKNAIKNLRQELATTSAENKSKLSSRLGVTNQAPFAKPMNFNLSEKLAEFKSKEPVLNLSAKLNKV